MSFVESFADRTNPAIFDDHSVGHHVEGEIVEARRCTVQMRNGFLYLDALASQATALLGHDIPDATPASHATLMKALAKLHPEYDCLAICTDIAEALSLSRKVGALIAGDARSVQITSADGEPIQECPGIMIAVENESLGRRGAWFASATGSARPSLIVVGNVLAAGKDFGAVFIKRTLAARVPSNALEGISGPAEETIAMVMAVIETIQSQQLVARAQELVDYFASRIESVKATCSDIAEVRLAGLSARIRLKDELSAVQIKRRLCERGLLVGIDDRGWLLIRPPLAIRLAEIDVISGVLRGALLGTATARAPICCSACGSEPG